MILKNKILYIFICCFLCLVSCSNSNITCDLSVQDSTTINIHIDDLGNNELLYSDIYSSVEYAVLESNDESIIGNIEKLEVTRKNDFIVFDRANGKIIRFDSKGKYLNKIGMMGHSKEEYINPELMVYDEYNDHVIVYDGPKKCLLHYEINGKLVKSTFLHKYIADFAVVNGTEIAIYANYRDMVEKGQVAFNLEIIDHEGNILRQYEPYSMEKESYRPSPTNILKNNDGKVLFHKYYSPIIYTIYSDSVSPSYHLDFMSKQIPSEWLELNNAGEIDNLIFNKESHVSYCTDFFDTYSKYILRATSSDGSISTIFVDKEEPSKQFVCSCMINDISGLISSYISYYKQNKLYCIINPEIVNNFYSVISNSENVKEYTKHMNEKGYTVTDKDISLIKKMNDNQNPIIQVCTLK